MRISDWSSDVCSSDLEQRQRAVFAREQQTDFGAAQNHRLCATLRQPFNDFDVLAPRCRLDPATTPFLEYHPVHAFAILGEIGRASVGKECVSTCRYRWSPYH